MSHGNDLTIVRKGVVISTGVNKRGFRGSSIHAEMDALRKLRWQKTGAEGADLWLFRFGGQGGDADRMSKPRADCMKAISEAGIDKVFYYDWKAIFCASRHLKLTPKIIIIDKWEDTITTTHPTGRNINWYEDSNDSKESATPKPIFK